MRTQSVIRTLLASVFVCVCACAIVVSAAFPPPMRVLHSARLYQLGQSLNSCSWCSFALAALHANLLAIFVLSAIFCATAQRMLTQFTRDLQQQLRKSRMKSRILLTLHFAKSRLLFIGCSQTVSC